jgi:hypothetical protein
MWPKPRLITVQRKIDLFHLAMKSIPLLHYSLLWKRGYFYGQETRGTELLLNTQANDAGASRQKRA